MASRTMPPANPCENASRVPVYSISGGGILVDPALPMRVSMQETPPKSPTCSAFSFDGPVCRICHDVKDTSGCKKLISPCGCTGSAQYIHKACLQKWTRLKGASTCEICHQSYEKKYVKFKMTSSEENTVASAITILLLLVGVLSVGIYLLAEYLVKLSRSRERHVRDSSEVWVAVSLMIIGAVGLLVFLPWFVIFCARTGRTPRSLRGDNPEDDVGNSTTSTNSSTLDASTGDSLSDGGDGVMVENAQVADERLGGSRPQCADRCNVVSTGAQTTDCAEAQSACPADTWSYFNPVVHENGVTEDSIHFRDNPEIIYV
ncbi:E3 ubiquitin-protein ligase MARCHF8-like [Diadema setosum]|uniref:E3 ubiquitin-protein ligase MARCHF8-like n=1 Tax=Diadema setosum TaxID=31175 RepID=UPI003B3A1C1B